MVWNEPVGRNDQSFVCSDLRGPESCLVVPDNSDEFVRASGGTTQTHRDVTWRPVEVSLVMGGRGKGAATKRRRRRSGWWVSIGWSLACGPWSSVVRRPSSVVHRPSSVVRRPSSAGGGTADRRTGGACTTEMLSPPDSISPSHSRSVNPSPHRKAGADIRLFLLFD